MNHPIAGGKIESFKAYSRWLILICLTTTYFVMIGCSDQTAQDSAAEETTLNLSVVMEESPQYAGWLYSYGIEWIRCAQESTWRWPSMLSSAHASHPITYTEIGEWSWHQRILIGEEQELIFQGPLGNHRYCGLHWLFAHGGIRANGILSSLQVELGDEVLATSHHAWALNVEFDEPLCSQYPDQTVQVTIPTQEWLEQTMIDSSPSLNTREATIRIPDFITVESPACP